MLDKLCVFDRMSYQHSRSYERTLRSSCASALNNLTLVMQTWRVFRHCIALALAMWHWPLVWYGKTMTKRNELTQPFKNTYTVLIMADLLTVLDALIACGVDNHALFLEETQAQRIADDVFDNVLVSCMDITFKELDDHFKTYSDLTVAQVQIKLCPGIRKNIKAFVQWTRDELRLGQDPSATPFPVNQVSNLIRRYKTHEKFQTIWRHLLRLLSRKDQGICQVGRLETHLP